MEYKLERQCNDCGNIDTIALTKIEAAFEIYNIGNIWNQNCKKCDSKNCASTKSGPKFIDKELLDIWGNDLNLFFMSQDEELILAEMQYFPMILNAIDDEKYLDRKIDILLESICILLYDNTASCEEYSKEENDIRGKNKNIVLPELIKRKEKIHKASSLFFDYIKEETFPKIGLQY